jgi:hydroxymethylbilane synthase
MHKAAPIRLGTRGSPLALAQAHDVAARLAAAHGLAPGDVEIVTIRTTGDAVQDRPLAEIGGKALWTKEIDRALGDNAIDLAVHSAKDVESLRPDRIVLAAALPRMDPRERIIGLAGLAALRPGHRVGTTSPRRAAQLLAREPTLCIVPFRGNVATRLKRIADGEAEATLLAAAGLTRLGLDVGVPVALDEMLPAPGQGIVAVECRADDTAMRARLAAISDIDSAAALQAERALAAALGGSCRSPVAAYATRQAGMFLLRSEILSADGRLRRTAEIEFAEDDAAAAGREAADELLTDAPPALAAMFAPEG